VPNKDVVVQDEKDIWLLLFHAVISAGKNTPMNVLAQQTDEALKEYRVRWEEKP
jgi:hypothetical protein